MKLSNADIDTILRSSQEAEITFAEAKAQLYQALIAKIKTKKKVMKIAYVDAMKDVALMELAQNNAGYNQALDEVNKIMEEFFE